MSHPEFPDTSFAVKLAAQILAMDDECRYWRHLALKQEHELQERHEADYQQFCESQENIAKTLTSLMDPNNALACAARAIQRDPLKGAVA